MEYDLIINKNDLIKYEKIELVCENSEVFSIPIEYVLDINCLCNRKKNESKNTYFQKKDSLNYLMKLMGFIVMMLFITILQMNMNITLRMIISLLIESKVSRYMFDFTNY